MDKDQAKAARLAHKLTQQALATFAGVSFRTIQNYEQGLTDVPGYMKFILERLDYPPRVWSAMKIRNGKAEFKALNGSQLDAMAWADAHWGTDAQAIQYVDPLALVIYFY